MSLLTISGFPFPSWQKRNRRNPPLNFSFGKGMIIKQISASMAAKTNKAVQLPISRVKTIMKSSPEVENVSNESIHLVAKATELFIQYLAQESLLLSDSEDYLHYKDVAEVVDRDQKLEFLRELIPQKITVREYKNIISNQKNSSRSSNTSNSSDDSSD